MPKPFVQRSQNLFSKWFDVEPHSRSCSTDFVVSCICEEKKIEREKERARIRYEETEDNTNNNECFIFFSIIPGVLFLFQRTITLDSLFSTHSIIFRVEMFYINLVLELREIMTQDYSKIVRIEEIDLKQITQIAWVCSKFLRKN